MADQNKIIKPVSFNKTKEADTKILKYVSRRNFSGFAKKAMLEYIERQEQEKSQERPTEALEQPQKTAAQKLQDLKRKN